MRCGANGDNVNSRRHGWDGWRDALFRKNMSAVRNQDVEAGGWDVHDDV